MWIYSRGCEPSEPTTRSAPRQRHSIKEKSGSPVTFPVGGEHKVRSFFNNIVGRWNPDSVTIDTHAVAAVHLKPFSSNSPEVAITMGGYDDNFEGLSGINAVYAEMYFRVAEELTCATTSWKTRQAKNVLMQLHHRSGPEHGSRFTVKKYFSEGDL
jgi:hypothetical protein